MLILLIKILLRRWYNIYKYDFPTGNYWVRVRGAGFCSTLSVETFAILSYADPSISTESLMYPTLEPPEYGNAYPMGQTLNEQTATCYNSEDQFTCAADLETHEAHRDDKLINATPDVRLFLGFKMMHPDNRWLFSEYKPFISKSDI